jgi:hypothetical protein
LYAYLQHLALLGPLSRLRGLALSLPRAASAAPNRTHLLGPRLSFHFAAHVAARRRAQPRIREH